MRKRTGWILLALLVLPCPGVWATDQDNPPGAEPAVQIDKYLRDIQRTQRNFETVDTNPQGQRRGRRGDLVLYSDGTGVRLCRNVSLTPGGGTSWSCEAVSTENHLCFEGQNVDDAETCFSITEPTEDRTVTIPNRSLDFSPIDPALRWDSVNEAGSATSFLRSDAKVALFIGTNPVIEGTASPGTASYAARSDHVHPASSIWKYVETLALTNGTVTSATLPTDADLFEVVCEGSVWNSGSGGIRFNGDTGASYEYSQMDSSAIAATTGADRIFITDTDNIAVEGTLLFGRITAGAQHGVSAQLFASTVNTAGVLLRGNWNSSAAITTVSLVNGGNAAGVCYLYKLERQT